jgi:hypothetical protein
MLTLRFEDKELDYVFQVLAQRPWGEVNPLIISIQRQVQEQQNVDATRDATINGSGSTRGSSSDPDAATLAS